MLKIENGVHQFLGWALVKSVVEFLKPWHYFGVMSLMKPLVFFFLKDLDCKFSVFVFLCICVYVYLVRCTISVCLYISSIFLKSAPAFSYVLPLCLVKFESCTVDKHCVRNEINIRLLWSWFYRSRDHLHPHKRKLFIRGISKIEFKAIGRVGSC